MKSPLPNLLAAAALMTLLYVLIPQLLPRWSSGTGIYPAYPITPPIPRQPARPGRPKRHPESHPRPPPDLPPTHPTPVSRPLPGIRPENGHHSSPAPRPTSAPLPHPYRRHRHPAPSNHHHRHRYPHHRAPALRFAKPTGNSPPLDTLTARVQLLDTPAAHPGTASSTPTKPSKTPWNTATAYSPQENTLLQETLQQQEQALKKQKRKQRLERIAAGAAIVLIVVLSL